MKKSTKIIIAIVSVLLVAGITVGVLFATGVLGKKSPQKKFIEQLNATTDNTSGINYSDYIAKMKRAQTEPYEQKTKMTMDVELQGELEEYEEIAELLNKVEFGFESKVNPSDKETAASINLKYDGKDLGKIELVADKEKVGFKIPEAYDKYLTVAYDDIMDAMESEGMDVDSLTNAMQDVDVEELIDILDISNDEITRILDRYKGVLTETLPEDNYSSEKEKITVNGKEINATANTVKISNDDLIDLLKAMVKSLKEDDATIELVVDKVNKVMKLSGETTTISKSDVMDLIEMLEESSDEMGEILNEDLEITLYEHDKATVRTAFMIDDEGFYIDSLKDGDTENIALVIKVDGEEITLFNMSQTKKGEGKYTTTFSMDLGDVASKLGEELGEGMKLDITVDSEETDNSMKENGTISVDIPGMIKVSLNIEAEAEYKSVSIDKLTSSNTVDATTMTTAQQQEFAYGLLDYVDNKMDIIKEIATVLGYEDEIEEFEKSLNALKAQSTQPTQSGTTTTPEDVTE